MIDGGAFVDDVTVEQASVAFPESHDEGSVSGFGQTLIAARCLGRKSVKKIDWISRQLVKKSILISSFPFAYPTTCRHPQTIDSFF